MKSSARHTNLLIAMLVALGALGLLAWSRMQGAAGDAARHAQDLAVVRANLDDLNSWHVARSSENAPLRADDTEFNRRLRAAAEVAQIPSQLTSIEPGQPARLHDSDFTETPVYVRLNTVTLRQLVTFLYQLSSSDRSLRSKTIELSAPEGAALTHAQNNQPESWTADVTLNNLALSPKPRDGR